jgi:cytochrome c-type biogenesis protein CcmH/NrfF
VTYLWVIPVVILIIIAVLVFYAVIKRKGGPGGRQPGRTVVDKTGEEPRPPGPQRPSET